MKRGNEKTRNNSCVTLKNVKPEKNQDFIEWVNSHGINSILRVWGELDGYIMYNNEDLERFYFQYQTEALPSGESVQSFCKRNNVPYNIFSKWYKDIRKRYAK